MSRPIYNTNSLPQKIDRAQVEHTISGNLGRERRTWEADVGGRRGRQTREADAGGGRGRRT